MISPELLRRYSFFGGLEHDDVVRLAQSANELSVDDGHHFFHEEDPLDAFYLVVEGAVGIFIEVPDRNVEQQVSGQLTGELVTKEATISTVGSGDIFGWSGLIAPYTATAGATAITSCRVVVFDSEQLRQDFAQDCAFGYLMTQKAAQVMRKRLRDIRIESLALLTT